MTTSERTYTNFSSGLLHHVHAAAFVYEMNENYKSKENHTAYKTLERKFWNKIMKVQFKALIFVKLCACLFLIIFINTHNLNYLWFDR